MEAGCADPAAEGSNRCDLHRREAVRLASQRRRKAMRAKGVNPSEADRNSARWKALRLQVLRRDCHTCAYCGARANTVDHKVPKSRGGRDGC